MKINYKVKNQSVPVDPGDIKVGDMVVLDMERYQKEDWGWDTYFKDRTLSELLKPHKVLEVRHSKPTRDAPFLYLGIYDENGDCLDGWSYKVFNKLI